MTADEMVEQIRTAAMDVRPQNYDRDRLLQEREKTHGDFTIQAGWAQSGKKALRQTPNWNRMSGAQQEALDMIMTKISRITHGDPRHLDSWDDISGYAKLGAEACGRS